MRAGDMQQPDKTTLSANALTLFSLLLVRVLLAQPSGHVSAWPAERVRAMDGSDARALWVSGLVLVLKGLTQQFASLSIAMCQMEGLRCSLCPFCLLSSRRLNAGHRPAFDRTLPVPPFAVSSALSLECSCL